MKNSQKMNLNWLGYQLYLFDLDDTLLMTRLAIRASWRQTLQHPRLAGKSIEEWIETLRGFTLLYGTTADQEYWQAFAVEVTGDLIKPHPFGEELCATNRKNYWQALQPAPNIPKILKRLQEEDRQLGLITNGLLELQIQKLTNVGLADFFKGQIYCSNQYAWAHQKPSPHMLNQVLAKRDAKPEKTVFFGNASIDVLAGNMAGVTTVSVADFKNPRELRLLTADYHLDEWPGEI
jgi:FMN phosphatase YigB (HAD superfamily)